MHHVQHGWRQRGVSCRPCQGRLLHAVICQLSQQCRAQGQLGVVGGAFLPSGHGFSKGCLAAMGRCIAVSKQGNQVQDKGARCYMWPKSSGCGLALKMA